MNGFLSPYRVLDLTDERGLLAGQILADLGADVIAVEPTSGSSARGVEPFLDGCAPEDPERSLYWLAYARNKRGITCAIDTREGRDLLLRLAATADFLFESAPPGTMDARGLGYDDLAAVNPRLVYTSITAFGQDGPKAHYADSDLIAWAAGVTLAHTGDADRPPVACSVPQAFLHAAGDAADGALIAHFSRLESDVGQHVDIAAQQSVAQATLSMILAAAVGHPDPGRRPVAGLRSRWEAADGWVELTPAMGPTMGHFTNNLLQWMFEEGACDEAMRDVDFREVLELLAGGKMRREELEAIFARVATFLSGRTKQDLLDAAVGRKLMLAPVAGIPDLAVSPQFEARDFFTAVRGPRRGSPLYPGPFVKIDTRPIAYTRHAPRLGEHNAEIYGELGIDEAELGALRERGVI